MSPSSSSKTCCKCLEIAFWSQEWLLLPFYPIFIFVCLSFRSSKLVWKRYPPHKFSVVVFVTTVEKLSKRLQQIVNAEGGYFELNILIPKIYPHCELWHYTFILMQPNNLYSLIFICNMIISKERNYVTVFNKHSVYYRYTDTIASKINVTPKIVKLPEKLQHSVMKFDRRNKFDLWDRVNTFGGNIYFAGDGIGTFAEQKNNLYTFSYYKRRTSQKCSHQWSWNRAQNS